MVLHPSKCTFFYSQVEYLHHMIYPRSVDVTKSKVEVLASIPRSKDMNQLGTSVGVANYYLKVCYKLQLYSQTPNYIYTKYLKIIVE